MGAALAAAGMDLGKNLINSVMGMTLGRLDEKHQDRRQYAQQERLQGLQIAGSKELTDYNYAKELQMWKDTSYAAQVKQMQAAGINPALMYGMGGGGGQSIGTGGSQVSGGQAGQGGNSAMQAMGMMLQNQNMAAQNRLLEKQAENVGTDTEKKKVETTKLAGVDTAEAQSRIDLNLGNLKKVAEETNNAKLTGEILDLEQKLKQIDLNVAGVTQTDRIQQIEALSEQAIYTARMIKRANEIGDATKQTSINQINASLGETYSRIALNNAMINKAAADIGLTTQLTGKLIKEIPWVDILSQSTKDQQEAMQKYLKNKTENENVPHSQQIWADFSKELLKIAGVAAFML